MPPVLHTDAREPAQETSRTGRPQGHRLGLVAIALMLLVGTIALPLLAIASEVRSDDTVIVGAGELIDEDLYVAASDFTLAGTANRDVYVAAAMADIQGRIAGSLNITGGDINLSGQVEQSVRVVGGGIVVSGTISRDLVMVGGTIQIAPSATIDGDLLVYGGQLDLDGAVGGDVNGRVASMTIDGTVGGDVNLDVESLDVASQAEIDGSLDYVSRQEADFAPGANVAGQIDHTEITPWGTGDGLRAKLFSPLVRTLWLLAAGTIMVALAPRLSAIVGGNVRRPWIPALVGLVSLVVLPIVAILLMVSIIGLPVGFIVLTLYFIALYLSQVVVGQRLGTIILPRSWNDGSRGFLLLAMTLGVILISALRFIPVPFVSSLVSLLVAIIGLGAFVLLMRQLRPAYESRVRA